MNRSHRPETRQRCAPPNSFFWKQQHIDKAWNRFVAKRSRLYAHAVALGMPLDVSGDYNEDSEVRDFRAFLASLAITNPLESSLWR